MTSRVHLVHALSEDNHAIAMAMVRRRLDPMMQMPLPMQQLKLVLLVCAGPSRTSRELAGELGVGAATMTGLVDRLAERGLLVRVPVPEDRRVRHIEATVAGQELARAVTSFDHGHIREIVDQLSTADLAALSTGMAAVRRALEKNSDRPIGERHR
jgi:DNA-binding MarR family transcriptional regulator